MKFIKQAFGELNFDIKLSRVPYDLLKCDFIAFKVCFSIKICIVVTDVVMTVFVIAKSVM